MSVMMYAYLTGHKIG